MHLAADELSLIQPGLAYAASYLEARREGYTDTSLPLVDQAQLGPEQLVGHLAALNQPERGARWADTPDGPPVRFAHLWIVTPHVFIGRVSIRYELTEKLLRSGGHIGYEIRPAYRGRGLGHRALQLGMEHLRARGIVTFLLTCWDDNAGSIRIIEAAGGVLEDVVNHPDIPGKKNCRYWIGRTPSDASGTTDGGRPGPDDVSGSISSTMVTIRQAGANDAEAMRDLLGQLGYAFTLEAVQDRLPVLAASGTDPVLLAVKDGVTIGLIALHFATMLQQREPVAQITALVVRDGVRGTGIGKALVDAGGDLARQSGCGRLELRTGNARTEAHAFYKGLGFANSAVGFSRSANEVAASQATTD